MIGFLLFGIMPMLCWPLFTVVLVRSGDFDEDDPGDWFFAAVFALFGVLLWPLTLALVSAVYLAKRINRAINEREERL